MIKNILIQLPAEVRLQIEKVTRRESYKLMSAVETIETCEEKVKALHNAWIHEKRLNANNVWRMQREIEELNEVIQRYAARKN